MLNKPVGKDTDGFISKYLNRKISLRITNYILRHSANVKPIHMTIISTLIGYLVFPFYIFGYYFLGGIFVQTTSILDGVDGELARALNLTSEKGAFLDSFLDRTVDILIFISASYYTLHYQQHNTEFDLFIYLLALSGSLIVSYVHARIQLNIGKDASLVGKIPKLASRDIRLFIIFLFSLFNLIYESLIVIAILSYIYVILKFFDIYFIQ